MYGLSESVEWERINGSFVPERSSLKELRVPLSGEPGLEGWIRVSTGRVEIEDSRTVSVGEILRASEECAQTSFPGDEGR